MHGEESRSAISSQLDSSLDRLKNGVQGYVALPAFPDEQPRITELQQAWVRFDELVRGTRSEADAGRYSEARQTFAGTVNPAGTRLVDSAVRAIEFNAQNGRALASRIKQVRHRTIWLMNALTACCVVLGIAGALLIYRQARIRRALVEAHSKFLEARAAELEQFAGRVAHDIRGPISTASMAAELTIRRTADEGIREHMNRIIRSLSRANAITTGLLEFARSGAQPDPGARTDVREVIADMASGVAPDAERARIEIGFEPVPSVLVACSTGVYLSLLSNLVRNAIKYMGDAVTRRITVRVTDEGGVVRTEVADTGPGIPQENLPSLFELHFRGDRRHEGLGLGLATVKKLAEGHNGRVGVTSERGRGSIFWFVLPRAGSGLDRATSGDAAPGEAQPGIRH